MEYTVDLIQKKGLICQFDSLSTWKATFAILL